MSGCSIHVALIMIPMIRAIVFPLAVRRASLFKYHLAPAFRRKMSLPSTTEAITIAKTGGIEVIEKIIRPFAKPNPGEIVVKVEYAGVNFIDIYHRSGLYPLTLPATIGREAAGTIVALPTDENILNNETFKKNGFQIGGKVAVDYIGSFATYVSIPWHKVFPVPESIPLRTAAGGLLQGLTALTLTEEGYNIQKGDTVLIHTIAGGVGLLLCQFAKLKGATVIGTTSTEEKRKIAIENGADHVIFYRQEDTVQRVLEITNGEGVHAVYDGVGKDTFDNNFKLIRRKGTIITYGNSSGAVPPFPAMKLVKNIKLSRPSMNDYVFTAEEGYYYGNRLFDLISKGSLKIRIFKEYPFTAEGVQSTHTDLTGGKTLGKLIINVATPSPA
ncbi:hypothetical protein AX15_004006 [Amanita polypyramis BW_CC]|nr:hypothetical protein AX15_004006 [Amanita polypyramis BW_CC]